MFGNKAKLNQVIDLRVEDMILNPDFYPQLLDFAEEVVSCGDSFSFNTNPLIRSIGFQESLTFLQKMLAEPKPRDAKKKKEYDRRVKRIVAEYLNDFKTKTRQFAKR